MSNQLRRAPLWQFFNRCLLIISKNNGRNTFGHQKIFLLGNWVGELMRSHLGTYYENIDRCHINISYFLLLLFIINSTLCYLMS